MDKLQPLLHKLVDEIAYTRRIASWSIEARDETGFDRVLAYYEDNGCHRACDFRGHRRRKRDGRDQSNAMAYEFASKRWKSLEMTIGPPIIDGQIAPLDVPSLGQALSKALRKRFTTRCPAKETDRRRYLALRAGAERPRG